MFDLCSYLLSTICFVIVNNIRYAELRNFSRQKFKQTQKPVEGTRYRKLIPKPPPQKPVEGTICKKLIPKLPPQKPVEGTENIFPNHHHKNLLLTTSGTYPWSFVIKAGYISNKIEGNNYAPKTLWEQLKTICYSSKQKDNVGVVLNVSGQNCHNINDTANVFNIF